MGLFLQYSLEMCLVNLMTRFQRGLVKDGFGHLNGFPYVCLSVCIAQS